MRQGHRVLQLMSRPSRNPDYPVSLQQIYDDWSHRRQGLLIALTEGAQLSVCAAISEHLLSAAKLWKRAMTPLSCAEVEDFYKQCDPDRENLCLYGVAHISSPCCASQLGDMAYVLLLGYGPDAMHCMQASLLANGLLTFLQKRFPQSCQSLA